MTKQHFLECFLVNEFLLKIYVTCCKHHKYLILEQKTENLQFVLFEFQNSLDAKNKFDYVIRSAVTSNFINYKGVII